MSRMLPSVWILCCAAFGLTATASAQERGPATRPTSPTAGAPRSQPERTADRAEGAQPRPEAETLRVEPISPELERVLKSWERASGKITKIEGPHHRYKYEKVFGVEERSEGELWYESPDKGRIDLKPSRIAKGEVSKRKDATGKPYELKSSGSERWLCTGTEVVKFNDDEKTVELFPIPPQHQGANIMEGPLPFLFGMPAEKAKLRFKMKLLKDTPTEAWIQAEPRWKSDAEQYQTATIILDKKDERYLPSAVQLIDPSGNMETVYSFRELKVNSRGIFKANWQKPDVPAGYVNITPKNKVAMGPGPGENPGAPARNVGTPKNPKDQAFPPADPRGGTGTEKKGAEPVFETVPNVVGLDFEDATARLQKLGLNVRYRRGKVATDDKQVFVVYDQIPKPRETVEKGGDVILTLYDRPGGAPKTADSGAEGDAPAGPRRK